MCILCHNKEALYSYFYMHVTKVRHIFNMAADTRPFLCLSKVGTGTRLIKQFQSHFSRTVIDIYNTITRNPLEEI